jgi:hypothetical protein
MSQSRQTGAEFLCCRIANLRPKNILLNMTVDTLRDAVRTGRPFKITTDDGRSVEIPHPEFAMISGSGRIFYVAKPDSDLFEAFDVLLITGVEQEGKLPTHK